MLVEIENFFYDACDILFADRSDWLPYMQYVGIAKGALNAGDGLWSLGHTLFERRRHAWRGPKIQAMNGKLHAVSGGVLIWSSLKRPQSMYTFLMIDAFIDGITACMDYIALMSSRPKKTDSNGNRIFEKKSKEYDEKLRKAEKLLIAKGLAVACWTLTRFLYPSVLLFVATATVYLYMIVQHAKPVCRKMLSSCYEQDQLPLEQRERSFNIAT